MNHKIIKTLLHHSEKYWSWKLLKILLIGSFCGSPFFINQAYGQDLPTFECTSNAPGLLFQGAPTTGYAVDLVTGEFDVFADDLHPQNVNGTGYNVLDDYVYGWVESGASQGIVRIGSDGSVTSLGLPGGYTPGEGNHHAGDVDENGHYWVIRGDFANTPGDVWFQIDLHPDSPTYMTVLDSGPVTGGGINTGFTAGADWAYLPGTDSLYRVVRNAATTQAVLFRFDRTTGLHENLGSLGDLGGVNAFGAVYADADGYLYLSNNTTGVIFRVDVDAVTADVFAQGPSTGLNDGARCFLSPIHVDYGDAPDYYGTTLAEDGPRHGIPGYDEENNTAPLMLGTNISHETDGQPSEGADADTFDDGVANPIVMSRTGPTTVEVIVTNNTDEPATLAGWIDYNQTAGSFEHFGSGAERQITTIPANSGTQTYILEWPTDGWIANGNTLPAETYARFRVFPGEITDPLPTGPASAGEVEDYVATAQTLEVFECGTNAPGMLFQKPVAGQPVLIQEIDLVTGEWETTGEISGSDDFSINGVGYNVLDGYFYGWHYGIEDVVRIGADGTWEPLQVTGTYPRDGNWNTGDVDDNGHLWLSHNVNATEVFWVQIDLEAGAIIDSGSNAGQITNFRQGPDWAYIPGTNSLYRVVNHPDTEERFLQRFDRDAKFYQNMGSLGNLGGAYGAVYADDQFLYAADNQSGNIWRIDVQTATATFFTQGPPSGSNDGARCPSPILTDYGDAPASYGTLLTDDGPRHGIKDFDETTGTAPLMLGEGISHETDGQPSADADADTFDDGVADPIVMVIGEETEVEVFVTNNTDEQATVAGWIDLEGTGTFDADDRSNIVVVEPGFTGTVTLTFGEPGTVNATYARFRVFPGEVADPSPTGAASAGEVEDYFVEAPALEAWACTPDGILTQDGDPTNMYFIDLVTGGSVDGPQLEGRTLNAAAYNVTDDYLYAMDNTIIGPDDARRGIIRIGADGLVQELGMPDHPELDPSNSWPVGDIDNNGHYWISNTTGGSIAARWYQIDLNPGPTFMEVLDWGMVAGNAEGIPTGVWVGSGDWAWVPGGGNNLWRVMRNNTTDNWHLVRFDMDDGIHRDVGQIPALNPQGITTFGAAYADEQFLYVSDNNTGDIFRVDVNAVTAAFFTDGPPSTNNDGARCAIAPIYTDFGDAPDSYGTLLEDNGPRHGLRDYDPDNFTASLMLGTQVDHETDGQPDEDAALDGFNDGVAEPIVLVDGVEPVITVTVTNNTDEPATLAGWIDLEATGTFDAGDRSNIVTVPANSGTDEYELTFAAPNPPELTYARFRVFPGEVSDPSPLGAASAGEVEDYVVTSQQDIEIDLTGGPCWRMLSSPTQDLTYAGMLAGIWTQGADGADHEGGDANVFIWDVSAQDWSAVTDLNQTIPAGQGFLVSVFDLDDFEDPDSNVWPKTLTIPAGPEHTAPLAAPDMNLTAGQWTLLGNPFQSGIDTGVLTANASNLEDAYYVYDRNSDGWVSNAGGFGDLVDGVIATGQGFFVQADGSDPSLEFTDDAKSAGGQFYGKEHERRNYVRLQVQGEELFSSLWVRFSEAGSTERTRGDALKLEPLAQEYALLASRKTDGTLADIGHYPLPDDQMSIPVSFEATQPGTFTITATDLDLPAGTPLWFTDLHTAQSLPLDEHFEYTFSLTQAAKASPGMGGITACTAGPQPAKTAGDDRFVISTAEQHRIGELPEEVALGQNYPNPFNPSTIIRYELPAQSQVRLEVFDMAGRRVATLVDGSVQAGVHTVTFDASHLSSGVYLYTLQANGVALTRKLTLIK